MVRRLDKKKDGEKRIPTLDDIDDFWDLDSLLPQRRPVDPARRVNTDTVELEIGRTTETGGTPIPERTGPVPRRDGAYSKTFSGEPVAASPRDEARRLRELSMKTRAKQNEPVPLEPYLVYEPENSVIKRVSVAKWKTTYRFYERFRPDAERLWDRTSSECAPVSFFSYIPQYNQLSYSQMKWYLYWRSEVRQGRYPRTDYSYILLYIYEILNCPNLVPPETGIGLLVDIWLQYRSRYPRIDSYLAEWVCDYCLINQLPCPSERLAGISGEVVAAAAFKEFYMTPAPGEETSSLFLSYSSNYDWRTSRYVTKDNINLFSKHIAAAFDKVNREVFSRDGGQMKSCVTTVTRDAYAGALCVFDMKRSITVEYLSYTRSPGFRFAVTDVIKYCENRVRMALGIKSRLKVENITDEMRRCVDEYFDENLPAYKNEKKRKTTDAEAVNEYDKLYEPVTSDFSLERARGIERDSWSTTDRLTSMLSDETDTPDGEPALSEETVRPAEPEKSDDSVDEPEKRTEPAAPETSADSDDEFASYIASLDETSIKALRLLAGGDASGVFTAASESGMLADALADRINETAYDIIGDSVIEPDGGGYRLISDYEGDIKRCLK